MLLSRSNTRGQNEPRYSQDELILALQKSPKHAAEATSVVLSTLRALRNSAFVWQYAIRRLRAACLVIQRMARRITTASKLSIGHAVQIWTADDEKIRVGRFNSITLAEEWRSESPLLFFTMEARVRTVTHEYERQRRSFRQFFRKYLRELRNLGLSAAVLEASLSKSRRQLFAPLDSANEGDVHRVSTDLLTQSSEQRRSLFAGSLAAGLRSSVLLQTQESRRGTMANQGLRGSPRIFDSIAQESAWSSERSVTPSSRSLSLSVSAEPNGARRSVSSSRSHGFTKAENASQERAKVIIRDSEERLIRAYNELHAFRQQVPVFEFVVDLKVLREKAMESYTAEAQKRVDETIKGLGVASSEWLSHRVAKDYALLSASADGIVATKTEVTQTKIRESVSHPRLSLGVTLKSLTDVAKQRGGGTLRRYRAEARLEDAVAEVPTLNTSSSRGVGIHTEDLVIGLATEQIGLNKVSLAQASPIHLVVAKHPTCPSTKDELPETSGEKSPAESHTFITELEEELTAFLRKRGQGGGSSSFSWSSRMQPHTPRTPRPKQGTGDTLEEARTPCPPNRASTMGYENIRLRHRLTNMRDLNATILAEQQARKGNKSLSEDVNANHAAHLRELSSQERVRHVEEQISRALSKDYVLAQDPSSKFVVPPRHLRVSSEELHVLDGFYPYHRFKEVHHESTLANDSKSRVGSVAHNTLHESDSRLEASRPSVERPRVVLVDPTSGKVSIQKHLLRHSYPSEYNAYRERQRGNQAAGQKDSTREENRVAIVHNNRDAHISPRLSVDLMDRIMAEHDFSGATRLIVREVATNWAREKRQADHTDRLTETETDVSPFARLESDGLSTSSAPFRRAPSSNSLKAPLTTLTLRRNHSRGITVVAVIDSLDESAVVCDGSRTEDGAQTSGGGKRAPKGTNTDEMGQKPSHLWANIAFTGDSSPQRPQSTTASRGQQSSVRVHSKHLVATGAFDGSLRITSFPDLVEVCYFQARSTGMISILKVSEDKQTLCAAADDGFVRIFKKRGPLNQWLSSWDLVQCLEISKSSGSQALSIALYGREHLAVGCYGGLLYVLPLSPARLSSSLTSSSELGDHQPSPWDFQTRNSREKKDVYTRLQDIPSIPLQSAQSTLCRQVPIELAAVLKLETNVSGVNKLLSYSNKMLITGGLDGQCNVIRLAYGEKAVRSMHEKRAESDAALSRAIAATLGVNDLPSLSPGGCETIDALLPATISSPSASVTNATRAFTVRASLPKRSLPDCIKSPGESVRTRAAPALPPFAVETARPFTCHSAAIVDLAYIGPFGDLVCSAGLDKRICVWDALSFDLRFTFTLSSVLRSPLVVIPTTQSIVCPLEDCTIVTLSAGSGSVLHKTSADQLRDPCVAGCLLPPPFRSDAPHLVAFGTYGGRIIVFDPSSGSFIASKVVHSGAVMCMSYCESKLYNGSLTSSPSSTNLAEQFLVSCSDDRVTGFTSFKAA